MTAPPFALPPTGDLVALLTVFAQLSVVAIGGVATTLPEMQRQVVDVHGWMTAQDFAALFALAQAAPGPNFMICVLVGWQVAGLAGAVAGLLGMVTPSSTITLITAGLWHRFRAKQWRVEVQAGLLPITVGLVSASAALLTLSTTLGWVAGLITLASTAVLARTRVHPLWVLAAGALLGIAAG